MALPQHDFQLSLLSLNTQQHLFQQFLRWPCLLLVFPQVLLWECHLFLLVPLQMIHSGCLLPWMHNVPPTSGLLGIFWLLFIMFCFLIYSKKLKKPSQLTRLISFIYRWGNFNLGRENDLFKVIQPKRKKKNSGLPNCRATVLFLSFLTLCVRF